jgi:hypothetical protein
MPREEAMDAKWQLDIYQNRFTLLDSALSGFRYRMFLLMDWEI